VQSFADEPLTECPACEGRLRKLFSSVGVVFKGSGFYRTDSRGSAPKDSAPATDAPKKDAPKDAPKKDAPKADKPASTSTPAPAAAA
jgi:predicted nucleic acid-binding Zn ribbon protein